MRCFIVEYQFMTIVRSCSNRLKRSLNNNSGALLSDVMRPSKSRLGKNNLKRTSSELTSPLPSNTSLLQKMANTSHPPEGRLDESSGDNAADGSSHVRSRIQAPIQNLPRPARYLLLVASSLLLSSSLLTLIAPHNGGNLAGVSKHLEEWWEAGGLIAWRAVDLGLAWLVGFDGALFGSLHFPSDQFFANIKFSR